MVRRWLALVDRRWGLLKGIGNAFWIIRVDTLTQHSMGSFLDEGVDPLDVRGLSRLPPLRWLLPGLVADHEEDEVGEGLGGGQGREIVDGGGGGGEEALVAEGEVGIVLLGLQVAAIAWVGPSIHTVRKE
jgi:hypothetical protein